MSQKNIYLNPSWTTTRQGLSVPLWSSHSPEDHLLPKGDRPILFVGGVHGDEPEGVWLAEAFLNWILTEYQRRSRQSTSLQWPEQKWVLIPCLNIEGFQSRERTNSAGIDLNRNFPSPDWSPEIKAPRYAPGLKPGSEPEVQGLIRAIEAYKPKLIIHFHSWKPCVVYTGKPAEPVARALSVHSGYPFQEDIGYPTPGSLGQYGWLVHQTPVICIEEQEGTIREHIWSRFKWALTELIK